MDGYLSSGSEDLDVFLGGGFEKGVITTIYGPGGSGKTNLCLMAMVSCVKSGRKVIYVDTESSFSLSRLKQIDTEYEKTMKDVVFLHPLSFAEQKESLEKLKELVTANIGLVIIDSIAMHYRLEFGKSSDIYEVNRDLGIQIAYLTELARKNSITVIVTNQVYSSFEDKDDVKLVGGDILKYGSKALIEIKKGRKNIRAALIRKHRSLPEGREFMFEIVEKGIEALER